MSNFGLKFARQVTDVYEWMQNIANMSRCGA